LNDEDLLEMDDVKDLVNVFKKAEKIVLVWLEKKCIDKGLEKTDKRLLNLVKD
jgi:hypothetical protein